MTSVYLYYSA